MAQESDIRIHALPDMNVNLVARGIIPICIELCRPICALSGYTIGIDVFKVPVVQITISGTTRLEMCTETK